MKAAGLFDEQKSNEASNYIVFRTLKKDDPEITLEEIEELPVPVILKLMKEISKLNGMPELDFQETMKSENNVEDLKNMKEKISQKVSQTESLRKKIVEQNQM